MSDPTTKEALELLAKVSKCATKRAFHSDLEALVTKFERREEFCARRDAFIQKLMMSRPEDNAYAARLLELAKIGHQYYSGRELIPDEFETLERHGLVHCSFGPSLSRTLEITASGRQAANGCAAHREQLAQAEAVPA